MKEKGTITEEEFQKEKARILSDEDSGLPPPPDPSKFVQVKKEDPKKSNGCLYTFLGLIGFIILIGIIGSSKDSSSSDLEFDIKYKAVEIVKAGLKAPSTAKFPSYSDISLQYSGNDQLYTIIQYDAQNAFGAYLRGYAKVYFRKSNGSWYYDHMDNE